MSNGTIIIAAHNESAVIGRTLSALTDSPGVSARIIVICNGCSDDTAHVASAFPSVEVVEIPVASKIAALREGDRRTVGGPRVYLDADVVLTARAAQALIDALASDVFVGRPPHTFDSARAGRIVQRWYRVRAQLPSISSALWGAGCYALSESARLRFEEFPDVISDDLFIDSLFTKDEVTIIDSDAVIVTTPRRLRDLVRILRRSYRTQHEVSDGSDLHAGRRNQLRDLSTLIRSSPQSFFDVSVYVIVIVYARLRARFARPSVSWERDASSRESR